MSDSLSSYDDGLDVWRLLWAYDVGFDRHPSGEIGLTGDRSILPPLALNLMRRDHSMIVDTYHTIAAIQEQLDQIAYLDVPDDWRRDVEPHRVFPGLCALKSLDWCASHAVNATFVHARIEMPDGWVRGPARRQQTWVKLPGGLLFHGPLQRFYTVEAWAATMKAEVLSTRPLTPELARRAVAHYRHLFRTVAGFSDARALW